MGGVASEALDNLVGQFSSAYDCFRELVQNSIDAGAGCIDIWTDYHPSGGSGSIEIHIEDDGEGMDRSIIDGQLTKLFSSRKEGDLTKIGKFGIGFVSIFALEPRAVLIHTGRGGEYWEVFFDHDRSFQLKPLDTPVEGTTVILFIEGNDSTYREIVRETRSALSHWCRHADTEISFEDRWDGGDGAYERIDGPFELDAALVVREEHPGTTILAGYANKPQFGFFNRGLALLTTDSAQEALGEEASRFQHISFKVKSRYLEHTLSRETVVRDENYDRAMGLLQKVIDGPLLDGLVEALAATADKSEPASQARFHDYCRYMNARPQSEMKRLVDEKVLRTLDGNVLSPRQALDAIGHDGRHPRPAYVASTPSDLALEFTSKSPVFEVGTRSIAGPQLDFLRRALHAAVSADSKLGALGDAIGLNRHAPTQYLDVNKAFIGVDPIQPDDTQKALAAKTLALMSALRVRPKSVAWVRPISKAAPLALTLPSAGVALEPPNETWHEKDLGLNISDPHLAALVQTSRQDLALGAYALAQFLLTTNVEDEAVSLALLEVQGE